MADRALTSGRIPCCVPFCRRTAPNSGRFEGCREIICAKHWRLARPSWRRAHNRVLREVDRDPRDWTEMPAGSPERARRIKLLRVDAKIWNAIKAEAIEAAGGIA